MEYHLKKLNRLSIFINHITADGKYATYYNIAMTKCRYNVEFLSKHRKDGFIIKREKKDTLEKSIADIGKKKGLKQMHPLITNSNFCIIGKNMKLWEHITGIKEWKNGKKMMI